ncbi:MAG: 3-phosphoshikimate 1-carboxyvinyltransferase [Cyclobacteriaceae bacterium]|nr:3-phosphoshikimate 1-carboxyvinyltransferase [Cyclobacteriaceae bacterium]
MIQKSKIVDTLKSYKSVEITAPLKFVSTRIDLVSSKSESNRALIINKISGELSELHNLSEARDTRTMQRLLQSDDNVLDVLDAGTTMRFITAYCAITGQKKIITGTPRMQERPIGVLTDALTALGCKIKFHGKDGYPPVETLGFDGQRTRNLRVRGDISSQYISALLMVAPQLPEGLRLELEGPIGSRPYINMTIAQMQHFGAELGWVNDRIIDVRPKPYDATSYTIESDWSGASYWFSIAALSKQSFISLKGLKDKSLQGDRAIVDIMQHLGLQTEFYDGGLHIQAGRDSRAFSCDFVACPDLAQTVAVACAGLGIECTMTGLESLRIKETDRIAALQTELAKLGASLDETEPGVWKVSGGGEKALLGEKPVFETYDDHRMAMAFAPLAIIRPIVILEPHVVEKSYPGFWDDLTKAGFILTFH